MPFSESWALRVWADGATKSMLPSAGAKQIEVSYLYVCFCLFESCGSVYWVVVARCASPLRTEWGELLGGRAGTGGGACFPCTPCPRPTRERMRLGLGHPPRKLDLHWPAASVKLRLWWVYSRVVTLFDACGDNDASRD